MKSQEIWVLVNYLRGKSRRQMGPQAGIPNSTLIRHEIFAKSLHRFLTVYSFIM